jgi:hypothetical protein
MATILALVVKFLGFSSTAATATHKRTEDSSSAIPSSEKTAAGSLDCSGK